MLSMQELWQDIISIGCYYLAGNGRGDYAMFTYGWNEEEAADVRLGNKVIFSLCLEWNEFTIACCGFGKYLSSFVKGVRGNWRNIYRCRKSIFPSSGRTKFILIFVQRVQCMASNLSANEFVRQHQRRQEVTYTQWRTKCVISEFSHAITSFDIAIAHSSHL